MRKLFGAAIVIAALLIIASVLFQNREPQTGEPRQPAEDAAPIPEPGAPDTGILLVNARNALPDDFVSEELVNLFDFKDRCFGLARSDILLDKAVYEAAGAMFAAAVRDGVDGFIMTSGYRSREKQEELYNGSSDGTVAPPGQSEHETGLAFDVMVIGSENGFDATPQFEWLNQNCWDYGFILRYPKGKERVTGIPYEPWHYRYVGLSHSRAIRDRNITLEEYLEKS